MLSEKGNEMAAYADDALVMDGKWIVVYSAENEPGYWATTYAYDDPQIAKATAANINENLGLSKERVTEIISSSMAAQNKTEAFLRGEGDPL